MPRKFLSNLRNVFILVNALFFIFALLNCGIFIQMYNSLITSQTVRFIDPKPFKDNELLQVLKEGRFSLLFRNKYDQYYKVSVMIVLSLILLTGYYGVQ
jgi:hypothetical protein